MRRLSTNQVHWPSARAVSRYFSSRNNAALIPALGSLYLEGICSTLASLFS